MTEPERWPCACGDPGHRNLGTRGYCVEHLAAFYRRLVPSVFAPWGIGLPRGDGALECPCCGATWVENETFPACPWCIRRTERERQWQAERVLTPPDVDLVDATFDNVMVGWADRLAVGVEAELITLAQARRSLIGELRRAV